MDRINGTVLISDKNRGLLAALVLLIQKYFSKVITEENPKKILELVSKEDIDIVVLDTGLHIDKGNNEHLNLIREIVALNLNIQVVALSNFGQNQLAMEMTDNGAFDFITKPWNNEKLLVTLRNAFKMRQFANTLKQVGMLGSANGEESQKEDSVFTRKSSNKGIEKVITLEQMEKKMMKVAIKRNKGNISLAAEELGITRQTLYNKGKKYELFE